MPYQTFQEFNVTGPEGIFLYPASVWAGFIPLVLFGIFSIITMASYFSQKSLTGRGDFLASITVASWLSLVISYSMSLIPGLIGPTPIIVFLVLTIISTLMLYLSNR